MVSRLREGLRPRRARAGGGASRAWFTAGVAAVGVQRLLELSRSRRNEAWIRAQGGRVYAQGMPAMRTVHAGWLVAALAEVHLLRTPLRPALAVAAGATFVAGQALRRAAIRALGRRWTVRVAVIPHTPAVRTGLYRHLRHPNYLGVALEVASLPLVHGAWRTALVFSLLDAAVLARRVAFEEALLAQSGDWAEAVGPRPRWVPRTRVGA